MLVPSEFTWSFRWFRECITGYMVFLLIIKLFRIHDLVAKYAIKLFCAEKLGVLKSFRLLLFCHKLNLTFLTFFHLVTYNKKNGKSGELRNRYSEP